MKSFFNVLILLAPACFFFSCNNSTGVSLTKRHYRNGYNVEMAGKIKNDNHHMVTNEFTKPEKQKSEQPEYASIRVSDERDINNNHYSLNSGIKKNDAKVVLKNMDQKSKNSSPSNKNVSKILTNTGKFISKIPFASKIILPKIKATNHPNAAANDGGNLVWTIIGVLLVLWLLSLLTGGWGLGGLIYLFLVVALVLILLRLLRVI